MYLPDRYKIEDKNLINKVMQDHPLATMVQNNEVNFLPFVLNGEKLEGHCAKASHLWKDLEANPKLKLIFHGPNEYISPSYYKNLGHVPTWNYVVVEVTGRALIYHERDQKELKLQHAVKTYEAQNKTLWNYELSIDKRNRLLDMIVGIDVEIEIISAKFKLGQNRDDEDYQKLLTHMQGREIFDYMN
jgi:transcriptional regulator